MSIVDSPSLISIVDSPSSRHQRESLKEEIMATPFFVSPGMSGRVRRMTRELSVTIEEENAGSPVPTMERLPSLAEFMTPPDTKRRSTLVELFVPELRAQMTRHFQFNVFLATLSALQMGYHISVLNAPEISIRHGMPGGKNVNNMWWSLIVSIFCIGGLVGASFGGTLSGHLGRKKILLGINLFFIFGSLLQGFAYYAWMLLIGRLLVGIGCGGVTVVVPVFLGELSPAQLRGAIGTLFQLSMVFGIFVSTFIGGYLDTPSKWRYLFAIPMGMSLFQLVFSFSLSESPLWLIEKKRDVEAKNVLRRLRGYSIESEEDESILDYHFDILRKSATKTHYEVVSSMHLLKNPTLRLPVAIGFGLMTAQQLSGINAIFYYSTSFFAKANVKNPWLVSVLATAINFIATVAATFLIERVGRKFLLLISSIGIFLSISILTVTLYLMHIGMEYALLPYICIFAVLSFVLFFELGLGPIPWLMSTEIFEPHLVTTAASMIAGVNWIFNFIVGVTFPFLQHSLHNMSFVPFGVVCMLCFILTLKYIPETKDKSVHEIQKELNQ